MPHAPARTPAELPLQAFISSAIDGLEEERKAAAAACIRLGIHPWVFEDKPASSDGLEESYLTYVRESEWLIWLVQETTPEAVQAEVRTAIDHGRRILAFVLSDDRDQATSELLDTANVKWEKPTAAELGEAVEVSLRDEQRRQLRRGGVSAAGQPPPPPRDFTGRARQLEELRTSLAQPGAVVVVNGAPGVGKSALAHAAADEIAERPVLWLDFLSGEAEPRRMLASLLTAVGAPPRVASSVAELQQAWAEATRASPVLLVVDDARAEEAVRPLLPSGADCATLLTARTALPGLEGAQHMHLDVFDDDETARFLEAVVGADRIDANRAAADELASLCGRLPLALRISAGRLAIRPDLSVADYAERLRVERTRLSHLSAGDLDVRTSFNVSYGLLSDEEAEVFRALGWFGGPTMHRDAVSAAVERDAGEELERLADAQLVTGAGGDRYEMHDLLRVFADEKLRAEQIRNRQSTGASLAEFYVAESTKRAQQVHGSASYEDDLSPLRWLDEEVRNLASLGAALAELELWAEALQVSFETGPLYGAAAAWIDWGNMLETAMTAAQQSGDDTARREILLNSGIVAANTGDPERADQLYRQAQQLAEGANASDDLARILAQRATLAKDSGNVEEALALNGQARDLYKQDGNLRGEAQALGDYANQLDEFERHSEAIAAHGETARLFEELGDRYSQALEIANLAIALGRSGQHDAAATEYRSALETFADLGAQVVQLRTQKQLAEALLYAGRPTEAVAVLDEAAESANTVGGTLDLAAVLSLRSQARDAEGNPQALADSRRACELLAEGGERWGRAVQQVATARLDNGPGVEAGIGLIEEALAVFRENPARPEPAYAVGAHYLAQLRAITGEVTAARSLFQEAIQAGRILEKPEILGGMLSAAAAYDAAAGFAADAQRARAELDGLPVEAGELEEIDALLAPVVRVEGADDAAMAARVRVPVAQALATLDRPDGNATVRLVSAAEVNDRIGRVNDREILMQHALIGDAGPDEPRRSFALHGMAAQHVAMSQGLASNSAQAGLVLEVIGEWFPRMALSHIYEPDDEPITLHPPDPRDAGTVGGNLGAALAGSAVARQRLQAWEQASPNPSLLSLVRSIRASWAGNNQSPLQTIQSLVEQYRT